MSPSLHDLQQEEVWRAEFVPGGIRVLRRDLLDHYGWDADAIGTIGDAHHLNGYHRSRAWIHGSQYCTNRTYSVSETDGNRTGGNSNAIAGMDIMTPATSAALMGARLRTAKAQGKLPMVREIRIESNPSHVHLGFDRGYVQGDLSPVFVAITGNAHEGQVMVEIHCTMPELKQEATGPDVETLQTLANLRGATLKVDGEFGPLTNAAVRDIQTRYGAESVDGIVGPETWTILLAGTDQD
jgi:Putative peptidoglycan binding domain